MVSLAQVTDSPIGRYVEYAPHGLVPLVNLWNIPSPEHVLAANRGDDATGCSCTTCANARHTITAVTRVRLRHSWELMMLS
eukprot:389315-Pyramimonas_sp.AAC.1